MDWDGALDFGFWILDFRCLIIRRPLVYIIQMKQDVEVKSRVQFSVYRRKSGPDFARNISWKVLRGVKEGFAAYGEPLERQRDPR